MMRWNLRLKLMKFIKPLDTKGFTYVDTLLGLLVTSVAILLFTAYLQVFVKFDYRMFYGEDRIHLHQLQLMYVLSNKKEVVGGSLHMDYLDEVITIAKREDKVIITPGYQVLYNDIESFRFIKRDRCLYVEYQHYKQKEVKSIVGC